MDVRQGVFDDGLPNRHHNMTSMPQQGTTEIGESYDNDRIQFEARISSLERELHEATLDRDMYRRIWQETKERLYIVEDHLRQIERREQDWIEEDMLRIERRRRAIEENSRWESIVSRQPH